MIHADNRLLRSQVEPYPALFFKRDGEFVRGDDPATGCDVFWSAECPEMLDISITGRCNRGCGFCYRSSSPDGADLPVDRLRSLLEQLRGGFICQIALGGGNPPLHPEFPEILRLIREDFGIVPNYTYNGSDLDAAALHASTEFCGAVAVSWYDYDEWFAEATRLIRAGVRTNGHFLLQRSSLGIATRVLAGSVPMPEGLNAIIFLTHKAVGRAAASECLQPAAPGLGRFLGALHDGGREFDVGFDSCFASALVDRSETDPIWYDYCEAGRFSAFVSEDMVLYPCSFAEHLGGVDLRTTPVVEAWQTGAPFGRFRDWLGGGDCRCVHEPLCRGGCPIDGRAYCRSALSHTRQGLAARREADA